MSPQASQALLFALPPPPPSAASHPTICTCATRLSTRLAAASAAAALALTIFAPTAAHAYGLEKGRLQKCMGDQPCVSSTSISNPSKFGAPWTYEPQTSDADLAWNSLKRAILAHKDGGQIVELVEEAETCYLRAQFPSFLRGVDDMEMRLIKKDKLVTYRSSARDPIYIYPIQTPLNNDGNRTRLNEIRSALGWAELDGDENT